MKFGAGVVAARKFGAKELVDPRPWVSGRLAETYAAYPEIGTLLPAMGYGVQQVRDLEETIRRTDCDTVVVATPIDLSRIIGIEKSVARVGYELQEIGKPDLAEVVDAFFAKR